MTASPRPLRYRRRRTSARAGWWSAAAGWACQVPAVAGTMYVSDIFVVLSLVGAACIGLGAVLLRGRATAGVILVALFGGMVMVVGVITGAERLAKDLWGKTAICQVQDVQRRVTTETERDSDGRPTGRRTVVFYPHTLACPDRTYTVNAARPHAAGSAVEVRYDPRGAEPPEFTDQIGRGELTFSAAALALGGLVEILLPIVAWRRGGRTGSAPRPPQEGGRPYGGEPRPGEPVPLESPRFEQTVRGAMGPSMPPARAVALPFVVRLLRRRMGVKAAPPPNPLAGRHPQQPPPTDRPRSPGSSGSSGADPGHPGPGSQDA
jgi:hypothetical protein